MISKFGWMIVKYFFFEEPKSTFTHFTWIKKIVISKFGRMKNNEII